MANEGFLWHFYGIYRSALNAYLIFTHMAPAFGENRPDKHSKFLKKLAVSLIVPHAKRRLVAPQTPYITKQVIRSCGISPPQTQVVQSVWTQEVFFLSKIKGQKVQVYLQ